MPTPLKILRHPLQSLVRLPQQRLFFFRGSAGILPASTLLFSVYSVLYLCALCVKSASQILCMLVHHPINSIQKSPRPINTLLAPLQILLRRRRKQRIQPPRIRPVLLRHLFRAHHVPARLRHCHAALLHHPLRKQPRDRLAMLHQSQVPHHLAAPPPPRPSRTSHTHTPHTRPAARPPRT